MASLVTAGSRSGYARPMLPNLRQSGAKLASQVGWQKIKDTPFVTCGIPKII